MNHVVLFSGGIGSWATTHRVVDAMEPEDRLYLIFTDTLTEDEDLYRFIVDAAANIADRLDPGQGEFIWLADGRDVWQVFNDEKFIGNTRVDICSRILKRDLSRRWINQALTPEDSIIYLGIDWTEVHRYERAVPHWEPWTLKAPLTEAPYLDKPDHLEKAEAEGIKPPRLYEMGFAHNNCGGFCVKSGHGSFRLLLENMPERYAYHEAREEEFRQRLDKDVAILRDRRGGTTTPLTLRSFRERIESEQTEGLELDDFAGCGCMVDFTDADSIETGQSDPWIKVIPLVPGERPDPSKVEAVKLA